MVKKSRKNYSKLSREEQAQLVCDALEDKPGAWIRLREQYKSLCIDLVKKRYKGYDFDIFKKERDKDEDQRRECELNSEIDIFLISVARNYDATKGNFSTYLGYYVQGQFDNYIKIRSQFLKLSSSKKIKHISAYLNEEMEKMSLSFENQPTEEQFATLANNLNAKVKDVKLVYDFRHLSREYPEWGGEDEALGDEPEASSEALLANVPFHLIPEEICIINDLREKIRNLPMLLPEEERIIIDGIYFKERTLEDIGNELGYSGERIRQKKENILLKLRRMAKSFQ